MPGRRFSPPRAAVLVAAASLTSPAAHALEVAAGDYEAYPPNSNIALLYYQHAETSRFYANGHQVSSDFGVTTVVERSWAKRMEVRCMLDTDDVDAIQRELAKVRAIPCIWIGEVGFDSLTIYGFFKDFSLDLAFANISYCSLTIEGLT